MTAPSFRHRRAMTLVELLVVLAILGLLGVAVSPLIQSRDDKQTFRNAADTLSLHFADAASRSIGGTSENGIWLEPLANSTAVVDLAFARTVTSPAATAQIAPGSIDGSIAPPTAELLSPITPAPNPGSIIRFLGSSSIFEVEDASTIKMLLNHNLSNDSFPATGVTLSYQLTEPPKRKNSFRARRLAGNACIDLGYSSLGLNIDGITTVTPLQAYSKLAILFDSLGRPSTAWLWMTSDAEWERRSIGSADFLVLLVGSVSQIGAEFVAAPSDENPGANIQNPYAVWLILDPKTGSTSIIENQPATTVFDAQKYVRQKFGAG